MFDLSHNDKEICKFVSASNLTVGGYILGSLLIKEMLGAEFFSFLRLLGVKFDENKKHELPVF